VLAPTVADQPAVAAIIPVGPGEDELARCRDTLDSLLRCEPAVRWLVLVDDSTDDRGLAALVGAGSVPAVALPGPLAACRRPFPLVDRVAAGVLCALRWVAEHTDAELVLELDTDALVIAPFAHKLMAATAEETVGLVGSYERTCNGEPRSFAPWAGYVQAAAAPLRHSRRRVLSPRAWRARGHIRRARANGYEWGEHALACGLGIPRRALAALRAQGCLDDPTVFAGTGLGDDPVLAILIRRCGYRLAGHVGEGETFGVAWRGLPDSPQRLEARGYSIIHSVKSDPRFPEREIREYFRRRRSAPSRLPPPGLDHGRTPNTRLNSSARSFQPSPNSRRMQAA
jgi:hypothetical protein